MKKLLLVTTMTALTMTSIISAPKAHAADDKKRMRSFLKSNKLKIRNVFDGIQCNGQNLVAFAGKNNAIKTGTLMLGKLPKAKVEGILATINSAELTVVAQKRING